MVEKSFPIEEVNMSSEEWRSVTLGIGNGVLDRGGQPYWLKNLDNASRTAQLTPSTTTNDAEAIIDGFYHYMDTAVEVPLPMPAAPTTYRVTLEYDPLEHKNIVSGPVRVRTYAGDPDTTQGKNHIVLWEIECQPNQLLTEAVVRQIRPKIAPTITVDSRAQLPPAKSVLWGTIAHIHTTRELLFAWGSGADGAPTGWASITNPDPTTITPHPWNVHYTGDPIVGQSIGGRVYLSGKVRRPTNEVYTIRDVGWPVCTLPPSLLPAKWGRYPVGLTFTAAGAPAIGMVDVAANGVVTAYVPSSVNFLTLDGIDYRAAQV
ncbi:hypothetical protein [Brevibacterium sp.]|uniref:hypothetical protein n=1 Tax=Brevibacterium sp. TaxID=1701 RepID=UPI002811EC2E|nr:hypothetical protein [Brevibacterium sp.]